jgi:urocanate hydratase
MRSAVRKLCQLGEDALKPSCVNNKWRSPAVSRRVAADLRKQAQREGTYGTFDSTTGKGWDPQWDLKIFPTKIIGNLGTMQLRAPKTSKRERTREARALKIEATMETMDEKIEEYYIQRQQAKPEKTFENHFKRLSRQKRK